MKRALASLTDDECEALLHDWRFLARPEQVAPPGDWLTWLILAGRGFGKTRTGAEWVREQVKAGLKRIHMIAPTASDARDTMVEGLSGLLSVCWSGDRAHDGEPIGRPAYEPSKRRLTWSNGAVAALFSAEEPERLRGPQCEAMWCDELAAWSHLRETWDMAMFGLRLGDRPRTCITTTPKPLSLLREIARDRHTVITRGSTFDNAVNLAPTFLKAIRDKYEGTRLGRQELNAEVLDDVVGALWTREMIDRARADVNLPNMQRIVVAVDPSGTAGDEDDGDEIGIVVAGKGVDGLGYVLADRTCKLSPDGWGRRAVSAYREFGADRIVAERNFGGAMVEHVIRTVDRSVSYAEVVASRGKVVRAEPVAALYEQGRVKHHDPGDDPLARHSLMQLEDQMCLEKGTLIETARGQVPVEEITIKDLVMTRNGYAPLRWAGYTGRANRLIEIETENSLIRTTECHPIFQAQTGEFVGARNVARTDRLLESPRWASTVRQSRGGGAGIIGCHPVTTAMREASCSIGKSTKRMWGRFLTATMSTMPMETLGTTIRRISSPALELNIMLSMSALVSTSSTARPWAFAKSAEAQQGRFALTSRTGCALTDAPSGSIVARSRRASQSRTHASNAARQASPSQLARSCTAIGSARTIIRLRAIESDAVPVYNLSVADGYLPEYFANGILTHNCAMTRDGYKGDGSPDRADAAVWALTELMVDNRGYDLIAAVG